MNNTLNQLQEMYLVEDIASSCVMAFLVSNKIAIGELKNKYVLNFLENSNNNLVDMFLQKKDVWSLYDVHDVFESLIPTSIKTVNGVVFTPQYICEYMTGTLISNIQNENLKIIDPASGCGIFLIVVAKIIASSRNIPIATVLKNNIFGLDISEYNVEKTKILLNLLAIEENISQKTLNLNVQIKNSLAIDWCNEFEISGFDYVIGNPPYVNTHDMKKDTVLFLKNNFATTKKGVFNIFYAFIEHSMRNIKKDGKIAFIVPNNFVTIEAGKLFRNYLAKQKCINKIINLGENMVFSPIRTYSLILYLGRETKNSFEYSYVGVTGNIANSLQNSSSFDIPISSLSDEGWHLLDEKQTNNIKKIESHSQKLGQYIRAGVATLKDDVYLIDVINEDKNYYFFMKNDKQYKIERKSTKQLLKVSHIRDESCIETSAKRIIFPYRFNEQLGKNVILDEFEFKNRYPLCYDYLLDNKQLLDKRDSCKINSVAWYAFGRSQGINNCGKKIIFPTFRDTPKFMMVNEERTLYSNGYAIFPTENINIAVLKKILNSEVMNYYVSNTSYSIEGGFYCYQKKYLKKFSIPTLTEEELDFLANTDDDEKINRFLINKYELEF